MNRSRTTPVSLLAPAVLLGACGTGSDDMTAVDTNACPASGEYEFVCGPQNAEDLVLIPDTNWVIAGSMVPGAPIYLIDAETRQVSELYSPATARNRMDTQMYQTCPGEPNASAQIIHGLNLREGSDGAFTLYAVAHGDRETIEVFDVDVTGAAPALTWVGCVFMPEGLEANSVASYADGSLAATVLIHPEFTFEDAMAGRPTGAIYQWSPEEGGDFERIDGTQLSSTNGIEFSADGSEIFSASSGLRTVVAFDRETGTQLRSTTTLPIIPDNVHMAPDGNLITAGTIVDEPACGGMPEPSEFDIEAYAQCPRGFMALSIDPETMQYTTLAQGTANEFFSNATMALPVGDDVWVGTFAGDRIAIVAAD